MNRCVVGLQWGDEGKGKIVDILAEDSDVVVRYNGGANAGHTVVVGNDKFALHLLPSGAVRPRTVCVITSAVVLDPEVLLGEIEGLAQKGISLADRLFISENAHLVLDYHKKEDQLREESLGKKKIGTTIRGIGPCNADKMGRSNAIRVGDLRNLGELESKLRAIVEYKNKIFTAVYHAEPVDAGAIFEKCKFYAKKLLPFTLDTTEYVHDALAQGKSVLFEGAQGTMLDIDHGTFPFVTSANVSALGMPAGAGVPAKMVDEFVGVSKAYTTRVGAGPFPTELDNETGQFIRDRGHEYGTTTGRPRRCGWFDAVVVSYSVTIGGIDSVALLHLDTLTGLDELKVCTGYEIEGKQTSFFPANIAKLAKARCVYKTLPGWKEDITGVSEFNRLPLNARNYVSFIEKSIKRPITMIGVGPNRNQTIFRKSSG
ncbi:MAG: adenylosuccinate synthase [Sedimentisphaerales bacterium]